MDSFKEAFDAGFQLGREWIGPNGDGTLGVLSLDFVREQAEMRACGFTFDQLTHVPEEAWEEAAQFMRGFHAGLAASRQGDW